MAEMGRIPSLPALGSRTTPAARIVGHRGMRQDGLHGNSIAALESAAQSGTRWVEFDIRRSGDGELVVTHDVLSGRRPVARTAHAELALVDGAPMPTVEAFARRARELGIGLDVELKEHGHEQQILHTLMEDVGYAPDELVFTSFDREAISNIRKIRPDLRTGLLWYELPATAGLRAHLDPTGPVRAAQSVGASVVAVYDAQAGEKLLSAAAREGIQVATWTVNDPVRIVSRMADERIAFVVSDLPGAALEAAADAARTVARSVATAVR